jgi:methionyl-tRNA formyltransferase
MVHQPLRLSDPEAVTDLAAYAPDIMVVAAYGLLLPPAMLNVPRLGCLNIHASLLPRWRGAAPVQRALLAGDTETGVALMQMEAGLDVGPVYYSARCAIAADDTTAQLTDRLARLGADALVAALPKIASGELVAQPQATAGVLYAHKVTKAEARIDWSRSASELLRAVRAYQPWPVAETLWRGAQLRVHAAEAVDIVAGGSPGTILAAGASGLDVATGKGILRLLRIQMAGRGIVSGREFIQSESRHGAVIGETLGGQS